jgi:hypothetical protein
MDLAADRAVRCCAHTQKVKRTGSAPSARKGGQNATSGIPSPRGKEGREGIKCFAPEKIAGRFFRSSQSPGFVLAITATGPREEPVLCPVANGWRG